MTPANRDASEERLLEILPFTYNFLPRVSETSPPINVAVRLIMFTWSLSRDAVYIGSIYALNVCRKELIL